MRSFHIEARPFVATGQTRTAHSWFNAPIAVQLASGSQHGTRGVMEKERETISAEITAWRKALGRDKIIPACTRPGLLDWG